MAKKTKKQLEEEERAKVNFKTLKQNQRIIEQVHKQKMQRHVKEKNEPVFDIFLDSFQNDYAKNVAAKSALEILKLVQSDDF